MTLCSKEGAVIHVKLPDNDLSDLDIDQKLELLELQRLSAACRSTEEGIRAGIIMMQAEFDRKTPEDLPLLIMVIHPDFSYTMYRKTGQGDLKPIRRGYPEPGEIAVQSGQNRV
jgi:hypothetical protein